MDFNRLPWQFLGPKGVGYLTCTGTEFRFGLASSRYAPFDIDYLNVKGVINDN
jgi:hypothetical protein